MTIHTQLATTKGAPRTLGLIWALLLVNALGTNPVNTVVPLPRAAAQVVTMGALGMAFMLALVINSRIRVRPNAYLLLLSLLVLVSVAASLKFESGSGALVRCARYVLFVATLWLTTPWWRGDIRFALYQIRTMLFFLVTVAAGICVSPGAAFSGPDGRLVGAIWPITAPQVGLYCAVSTGLSAILWVTKQLDGRSAAVIAVPAIGLLLLSHTRTALLGMVVALVVAGLSLLLSDGRVRRLFGTAVGVGVTGAVVFAGAIQAFLLRGQDADQLASLTGRAKVWDLLLAKPRTLAEQIYGVGLTDKSFAGLPIDSTWLSVYHEQGLLGIGLVGGFLLALLMAALLRPSSPQRACALFLIVYCVIASYTEVGLGDASPYLLNLAVASSLLVVTSRNSAGQSTEFLAAAGPTDPRTPSLPVPSRKEVTFP